MPAREMFSSASCFTSKRLPAPRCRWLRLRRSVELQVDPMNAGRAGACCEAVLLKESDSVRDDADAIEADLLCARHGIKEIRCDRRFATRKQNVQFTLRVAMASIEDLTDVVHRELVILRAVVGVQAGRAFQIAAVRQVDNQSDSRPVRTVDGPWS